MSAPSIGKPVADFSLPAANGKAWSLRSQRGHNVVLYFYPRDNTPGCTREGEAFRDLHEAFRKSNTIVAGISPDSAESHGKFRAKMRFPFELLSDEGKTVCRQFGVIRQKSLYGRKFMGVERSTFLLDATGRLRYEWRKVKVDGHAEQVLEAVKTL
jgi:peroxiredoxin Q/BCP